MPIKVMSAKINSKTNGIGVEDLRIGDVGWLRNVYNEFNKIYFGGRLPGNLRFEWSTRMKVTAGSCHYRYNNKRERVPETIKISVPFMQKNPSEFFEVMIHEMIHVRYPEAGHGPIFYSEMERINMTYDLQISRHTKNKGVRPYLYGCLSCKEQFTRARRFNVSHYSCGRCGGKLEEKGGLKYA